VPRAGGGLLVACWGQESLNRSIKRLFGLWHCIRCKGWVLGVTGAYLGLYVYHHEISQQYTSSYDRIFGFVYYVMLRKGNFSLNDPSNLLKTVIMHQRNDFGEKIFLVPSMVVILMQT
jgi:hypothetical protein